jgi:sugar lactone lactonase YvrE
MLVPRRLSLSAAAVCGALSAACASGGSAVDRDIAAAVAAGNAATAANAPAAMPAPAGANATPDTRIPLNVVPLRVDSTAPQGVRAPDGSVAPLLAARPAVRRSVMVAYTDSLRNPESATYDAALDAYFVSNINGPSTAKDGNGFISRVTGEGRIETLRLVAGGVRGATLNAPKGMAIVGDTLWVADIDALRAFDKNSGAAIATVDLAPMGAKFLNDVAVGPDGALYITDSGIRYDARGLTEHPGPDRIFRVAGRTPTVALESARLMMPNGIAWDASGARFVVVPMGGDTVMTWRPGAAQPEPLVAGPGQYDGVALAPDGRLFVSSAATSAVHVYSGGRLEKVIEGVQSPADISFAAKRGRIAVPLLGMGRVQYFELR